MEDVKGAIGRLGCVSLGQAIGCQICRPGEVRVERVRETESERRLLGRKVRMWLKTEGMELIG